MTEPLNTVWGVNIEQGTKTTHFLRGPSQCKSSQYLVAVYSQHTWSVVQIAASRPIPQSGSLPCPEQC